jgi:uncharacterized membrane protein YgcG
LAIISLGQEMANYVQKLEGVPDEKKTEILAIIATGDLLKAEQEIDKLTRPRTVTLGFAMPVVPKFHSGTRRVPGGYGEESLAVLEGGEEVISKENAGRGGGGGGGSSSGGGSSVTNNITINMPPGSNGADVVEVIRKYERMHGAVWQKAS